MSLAQNFNFGQLIISISIPNFIRYSFINISFSTHTESVLANIILDYFDITIALERTFLVCTKSK